MLVTSFIVRLNQCEEISLFLLCDTKSFRFLADRDGSVDERA